MKGGDAWREGLGGGGSPGGSSWRCRDAAAFFFSSSRLDTARRRPSTPSPSTYCAETDTQARKRPMKARTRPPSPGRACPRPSGDGRSASHATDDAAPTCRRLFVLCTTLSRVFFRARSTHESILKCPLQMGVLVFVGVAGVREGGVSDFLLRAPLSFASFFFSGPPRFVAQNLFSLFRPLVGAVGHTRAHKHTLTLC